MMQQKNAFPNKRSKGRWVDIQQNKSNFNSQGYAKQGGKTTPHQQLNHSSLGLMYKASGKIPLCG